MSFSTMKDLDFLLDRGKDLSALLRYAKTNSKEVIKSSDTLERVKVIIFELVKKLKDILSDTTEESGENLVNKIGMILQEFIKHDSVHKSGYEDLAKVVSFLNYRPSDSVTFFSEVNDLPGSSNVQTSSEVNDSEHPNFISALRKLSLNEREYLRCFLLFPVDAEIKKREIIHCWIGMDLDMDLKAPTVWERLLAKFVAMGLIQRISQSKKLFNIYKMPNTVLRFLNGQIRQLYANDDPTLSILRKPQPPVHHKPVMLQRATTLVVSGSANDEGEREVLINICQTILSAEWFNTISKFKNLKVVHLGNWRQDSTKYIVVEGLDAFKDLKNLTNVRFLSLEGVSGMVQLPLSVYELKFLKVLDLRGCNNLEHLPTGIRSLVNLTHLDLSGCYLLDHVPMEIIHLVHLRVLKGFIINPEDVSQEERIFTWKGRRIKKRKGRRKEGRTTTSTSCPFYMLANLSRLTKLTIFTWRKNFPMHSEFCTLSQLKELICLRITWAEAGYTPEVDEVDFNGVLFPPTLTKLDLQAPSDATASRLLRSVSEDTSRCGLEKLYLRGGGLRKLNYSFPQPTFVRLRYLPHFRIDWDNFRKLFPNLDRLEVLQCPSLISFPCDENGVWERARSEHL